MSNFFGDLFGGSNPFDQPIPNPLTQPGEFYTRKQFENDVGAEIDKLIKMQQQQQQPQLPAPTQQPAYPIPSDTSVKLSKVEWDRLKNIENQFNQIVQYAKQLEAYIGQMSHTQPQVPRLSDLVNSGCPEEYKTKNPKQYKKDCKWLQKCWDFL